MNKFFLFIFLFLSQHTSVFATPSIDNIISRGVKVFGVDSNGTPNSVLGINSDGSLSVTVTSTALAPNASTSANQSAQISALSAIQTSTSAINGKLSTTTNGLKVDPLATLQASTATQTTSASVTTTSVAIIGANANRRCLYIWNNSANSAYITFGPTSASATPTVIVPTFTSFVMASGPVYTGQISAIRNSGSGTMTITECLP